MNASNRPRRDIRRYARSLAAAGAATVKSTELAVAASRVIAGRMALGFDHDDLAGGSVVDCVNRAAETHEAAHLLSDLEDAIAIANGIEYGLSSALYTKDVNRAFVAMRDLHAGITYINAPTIGAEVHLPFGGVKATGNGHREGGMGAIDFYTEWKAIYVDYSDRLQKAQIDRVD